MAKFDPQKEVETLCKDYQWRLLKGKDNPFTGFDATIDTGLTFIPVKFRAHPLFMGTISTLASSISPQSSKPAFPLIISTELPDSQVRKFARANRICICTITPKVGEVEKCLPTFIAFTTRLNEESLFHQKERLTLSPQVSTAPLQVTVSVQTRGYHPDPDDPETLHYETTVFSETAQVAFGFFHRYTSQEAAERGHRAIVEQLRMGKWELVSRGWLLKLFKGKSENNAKKE